LVNRNSKQLINFLYYLVGNLVEIYFMLLFSQENQIHIKCDPSKCLVFKFQSPIYKFNMGLKFSLFENIFPISSP